MINWDTITLMFEILFLLIGLSFSILVYILSIKNKDHPAHKKAFYFVITTIGITGFLLLFGIMVSDAVNKLINSM